MHLFSLWKMSLPSFSVPSPMLKHLLRAHILTCDMFFPHRSLQRLRRTPLLKQPPTSLLRLFGATRVFFWRPLLSIASLARYHL